MRAQFLLCLAAEILNWLLCNANDKDIPLEVQQLVL